jgi:hypothetical protein
MFDEMSLFFSFYWRKWALHLLTVETSQLTVHQSCCMLQTTLKSPTTRVNKMRHLNALSHWKTVPLWTAMHDYKEEDGNTEKLLLLQRKFGRERSRCTET